MSTIKTEHTNLTWNPHPHGEDGKFLKGRLEGTYRGVKLEQNVVYQADLGIDQTFGRSLTPGIFTGTWLGVVDSDGEPLFRHVDDHSIVRRFVTAKWFDRLENL